MSARSTPQKRRSNQLPPLSHSLVAQSVRQSVSQSVSRLGDYLSWSQLVDQWASGCAREEDGGETLVYLKLAAQIYALLRISLDFLLFIFFVMLCNQYILSFPARWRSTFYLPAAAMRPVCLSMINLLKYFKCLMIFLHFHSVLILAFNSFKFVIHSSYSLFLKFAMLHFRCRIDEC